MWPIRIILVFLFIALGWHLAEITRQPPRDPLMECAPEELMLILEKAFNISFPEKIEAKRTARRVGQLSTVSFMVRFSAEPSVVDTFLGSFPEGIDYSEEYDHQEDSRAMDDSIPTWYTEPIQKGKVYHVVSGRPRHAIHNIYVDTKNERKFIVYCSGFYSPSLLRKEYIPVQ